MPTLDLGERLKYVNVKRFWLNLTNTSEVEFKTAIQDIDNYWHITSMSGRRYSSVKDFTARYIYGLK